MSRRHAVRLAVAVLSMLPPCACISGEDYAQLQRELLAAQDQVRKLQQDLAARDQTIDLLKSDVARARDVDPGQLELLVVPERIEIERQSGGFDADGKPGDDELVLYIRPIDRNGDVVKAAGSIAVTLLDLTNPSSPVVLGEYQFDARKTRELWYGRMWTHHFTVRCPWFQGRPPPHEEITARVEFTDLLSGRKLTAQGVFRIDLPGRPSSAATQ